MNMVYASRTSMNSNIEKKMIESKGTETKKNDVRRILYYLPLIVTKETIHFSDFRLVPFKEDSDYSEVLPQDIFHREGTLLEVDEFKSGDLFDIKTDQKMYDSLEKIKFGYFLLNPSHTQHIYGYVSNDTFECFRLVERNPDPSFEHKVPLSNGMYHFSHSLKKYYESRSAIEQRAIEVSASDFYYVDFLTANVTNGNAISAMKLYNRCWNTYSLHSNYDKALLSRASTEAFLQATLFDKKNFIENFANTALTLIKKNEEKKSVVATLAKHIHARKERIVSSITKNIFKLKEIRDKYAHDGTQEFGNINIPFFLTFFPILWMVEFKAEQMSEAEHIRLCLFLCLMNYEPDRWQDCKVSTKTRHLKHSSFYIYAHNSRVIPVYLANKKDEVVDMVLKGIIKWIEESDKISE